MNPLNMPKLTNSSRAPVWVRPEQQQQTQPELQQRPQQQQRPQLQRPQPQQQLQPQPQTTQVTDMIKSIMKTMMATLFQQSKDELKGFVQPSTDNNTSS